MKQGLRQFLVSGMLAGLLPACGSSPSHLGSSERGETGPGLTAPALPSEAKSQPVARSPEQRNKIEAAVRLVLDAHGFVPPVIIEGQDAVSWAFTTRAGSERELVMASVKMAAENEVTVELLLYAHVGSTWALLGHEFRGLAEQEARQMNEQIRERLAQ